MLSFTAMRNTSLSLFCFASFVLVAGCGPTTSGDDGGTDAANLESCSAFGTCEGGLTCCDGFCIDTENNPDHCGACGIDCSNEDGFCSSDRSCSALTWNAICDNANVLALKDGNPQDDATTDTLRDEVQSLCGVTAQSGGSTDASLVNADGSPTSGVGTTVVMGGGGFFQPPIRFVESQGVTGVYADQIDNGNTSRMVRRDGTVLATVPSTTTGEGEDWFTVYLVEEPVGGALLLAAYGFTANGTEAAGLWAPDAIFADPSGVTNTWFVVHWTDTDGAAGPSGGDTFEVIDSGT